MPATTAVVTGGAGFIGSHVVDRLLGEGYSVVVVDDLSSGTRANLRSGRSDGVELVIADIGSADATAAIVDSRPELIVHAAAQISVSVSTREPVLDARVNVLGSLSILEAARTAGVRKVLFISTGGAMYGEPDRLPVDELHPPRPASPYGAAKLAVEGYLGAYRTAYGLDSTALRLANVYGPRQDPHGEAGVVAIFSRAMLADRPVTIFGDGEDVRDYVYVEDVAAAVVTAAGRGPAVYNVGTGTGTSVNDLFRRLADATGYGREPLYGPPRPGDIHAIRLDSGRAHDALDWSPTVSLEDGLERTVSFFREQRERQA